MSNYENVESDIVLGEPNTDIGDSNVQDRRKVQANVEVGTKRFSAVLNRQRLTGPNGIECLEQYFKDVRFKGKGHEREDLNNIMYSLEQWIHRLHPKFTFDDTLKRIEKLGCQSQVKTYVKRMKLGFDQNDTQDDNLNNSQLHEEENNS